MAKFTATSFDVSLTEDEVLILTQALYVLSWQDDEHRVCPMFSDCSSESVIDLLEQFKKVVDPMGLMA